ncbi:MAG: hypothetical protein KBT75_16480 [Oleispira antarctica]|nr:hypothetical protein [Oleispira antarctica]
MNDEVLQPFHIRILSVVFFVSFSVGSLVWFGSSLNNLVSDLINMRNIITFDKGAMYVLGAGVGALSLSVAVVYAAIYQRKVSFSIEKVLIKIALIAVVVMFVLPQIAHVLVNRIIDDNSYQECKPLSYRWMLYKKYVFTQDEETCINLVAEKALNDR